MRGSANIVNSIPSPADGVASIPAVGRIPAIEGLRAWLAWTVVIYHLVGTMNLDLLYGVQQKADLFGQGAVHIFIMISGFVIAGLMVERSEKWVPYITRRAFRLFPAYWVALALGVVCMYLKQDAFQSMTWVSDPLFAGELATHNGRIAAVEAAPWTHGLLHLGLLQGLPPPSLVPHSAASILGPAWSLTLEWQFYLVAPALVWMMRRQVWAIALILGGVALLLLSGVSAISPLLSEGALPRWLFLFNIGILSRIALPYFHKAPFVTWATAIAIASVAALVGSFPTIPLWLAFVAIIARTPDATALARGLGKVFGAAFESRLATHLGARSYSVYVLHSPILQALLFFILPLHPFTRIEAFVVLTLATIPVTLIASGLCYRYVELPMIALGARLAARLHTPDAPTFASPIATAERPEALAAR